MYVNPIFLKEVPENTKGRDFVVGDMHGCYNELSKLMEYVQFNPQEDRMFSTGDLIDRGPNSLECLSLLKKKWFYPTLGNHEDIFLSRFKMFEEGKTQGFSEDEINFIRDAQRYVPDILEMPLVYEINHKKWGKVYIVHAEILPEHIIDENKDDINNIEYNRFFESMKKFDFSNQIEKFFNQNKGKEIDYYLKQKLIWSRSVIKQFGIDHQDDLANQDFKFLEDGNFKQRLKIFCGHNIVPFPIKIGQQMYIDTGAALGHVGKAVSTPIFTQFGHKYFTLTMVDVNTGTCYACITSESRRGEIVKSSTPLYK